MATSQGSAKWLGETRTSRKGVEGIIVRNGHVQIGDLIDVQVGPHARHINLCKATEILARKEGVYTAVAFRVVATRRNQPVGRRGFGRASCPTGGNCDSFAITDCSVCGV